MNEKDLRTSKSQRIFISIIAVAMLGSIIAGYALMIASGGKTSGTSGNEATDISEEKKMQIENEYNESLTKFKAETQSDFNTFVTYKSRVTAYNEASANDNGVVTNDIVVGNGRTLSDNDTDYMAFYIGWCADESIFDSTLDDNTNPTAFKTVLPASKDMIEGWKTGVAGMNINGIREVTIPGSLAYKEDKEICGGYNKPLKFLIMAKPNEDPLKSLSAELEENSTRWNYARFGLDYDAIKQNQE